MSLLQKLFKKEEKNYGIALDIGTEVVKALIFKLEENEGRMKIVVLGVGRRKQNLGDMQAGAVTNIGGVVESCRVALEEAVRQAKILPEKAIVGIAGELVKGETITVHYERLNPSLKIDLSELKNIIQKVQWKAFDQVRQQLSWETGYPEIDVKLVNAAIVDVRIDGYKVTNPLGFQGKDVQVGIFNAFAPLVHLGALQTITGELGLDLVSITAEPYAVARSMRGKEADFSAIFMDIGGGTTDIAVVSDGGVVGTKMFGLGGRAFTKRLASLLGVSFEQAEKIKIDYANGLLTKPSSKKIKEALLADSEVWLSGVELSLSEFFSEEASSKLDLLPSVILLCGGGSQLPEIKEVLASSSWIKRLPFPRKPRIHFIKPHEVSGILDKTSSLTSPQDITPMALANLSLDLSGEEELLPSILRKAIRLLQT